jgi:chemotaxis family two-component system response regulator Rcp1
MMPTQPVVLMVDDNVHDIELVQLAFEELACPAVFHALSNGEKALSELRARAMTPDGQLPCVLLLDLNMPRLGGLDMLAAMADVPRLRAMPVVIFTSSDWPRDRHTTLAHDVRMYVVKAHGFDAFIASLRPVVDLVSQALAR